MIRSGATGALVISAAALSQFQIQAQTFETSSIQPSPFSQKGFSFKYVSSRQFAANNHTFRECIGFAYDVNPALVSGGPAWLDSERYNIAGLVPGDSRPPTSQLLLMFQSLLADRLKLVVHRAQEEVPVYRLVLGADGFKLKEDTSKTEQGALLLQFREADPSDRRTMVLPARNVRMPGFASLLQRSVLDRPVLDRTGLSGRYDFDLEWKIDGTKFDRPLAPREKPSAEPDIFNAVRQLGLNLEPGQEAMDVIVIDHVERVEPN